MRPDQQSNRQNHKREFQNGESTEVTGHRTILNEGFYMGKMPLALIILQVFLFCFGIFLILNYGFFHWLAASPSQPDVEGYVSAFGSWMGVAFSGGSFLIRLIPYGRAAAGKVKARRLKVKKG